MTDDLDALRAERAALQERHRQSAGFSDREIIEFVRDRQDLVNRAGTKLGPMTNLMLPLRHEEVAIRAMESDEKSAMSSTLMRSYSDEALVGLAGSSNEPVDALHGISDWDPVHRADMAQAELQRRSIEALTRHTESTRLSSATAYALAWAMFVLAAFNLFIFVWLTLNA